MTTGKKVKISVSAQYVRWQVIANPSFAQKTAIQDLFIC
jgi:hypothetical protein